MSKAKEVAQLRRVPRRAFESSVGVLLHGEYKIERSFQLGEGGMMISCSRPLISGERLVASFVINQEAIVMVRAIVRGEIPASANAPHRYNLEFEDLEFHFKRAIRNYVAAATHAEGLNAANTIY